MITAWVRQSLGLPRLGPFYEAFVDLGFYSVEGRGDQGGVGQYVPRRGIVDVRQIRLYGRRADETGIQPLYSVHV